MRKEYLPFSAPSIGVEEIAEVVDTLRSEWITTGPKVKRFEEEFAAAVEAEASLALSSCTAALHLALVSLGIGPGDAVLTTPMTFCSGVHVIEQVGAHPVLVDVAPDTLNIDVAKVREAVEPRRGTSRHRLKAILPVHLYGHPCDMNSLMAIAQDRRLAIIEDAAHALPAKYGGRTIGSRSTSSSVPVLTCFSFYATKNLTTSEGGMLTGPPGFVDEARLWSHHGMSRDAWNRSGAQGSWRYEVVRPGFKYNMSDVQAAIGLGQLPKLARFQMRRAQIAHQYNEAFAALRQFQIPAEHSDVTHAWHLYALRLNLRYLNISRDQFIEELSARNIGSSVHFIPVHLHPYYRDKYGYRPEDFPVAYNEYQRTLSLPLHPKMTDQDVTDVIEAVNDVASRHAAPLKKDSQSESGRPDGKCLVKGAANSSQRGLQSKSLQTFRLGLRRAFDMACAVGGLVLLSPLFALIGAAIKLDDGGPVFFSHLRVGKKFRKFPLLKFRTMIPDSHPVCPLTAPEDPRITRVGGFLRRYKLDELPQLVNVVRGEMQLVGVRPQVECFVEAFPSEYAILLQEPPGITDLATLAFRDRGAHVSSWGFGESICVTDIALKVANLAGVLPGSNLFVRPSHSLPNGNGLKIEHRSQNSR